MKMRLEEFPNVRETFTNDGFVSALDIIPSIEATKHRARLEATERKVGNLHYKSKVHTILCSPYELATHPRVLDIVEQLIGPDILLYNVEYIVKESRSPAHVSWHQDLTYWGFDDDAQVSMWLALSEASAESGCMRMIPGSHAEGRREHVVTHDAANVLLQGQTVQAVDETGATLCALHPGQASFHHGWTLHSSLPNTSDDRRIGLNVQYIAPSMRQTKHDEGSALLVRGEDHFKHFREDQPATSDLDPIAVARHNKLDKLYQETAGTG
jgi:ectoine hydroxylase-related dioxygenase (phytanoyl-CoA dioxygenase family)